MSPPRSAFICQRFHQDIPPTPTKQRQRRRPGRGAYLPSVNSRRRGGPTAPAAARGPSVARARKDRSNRNDAAAASKEHRSISFPAVDGRRCASVSVCVSVPRRRYIWSASSTQLRARCFYFDCCQTYSPLARCQDFCGFRRSWTSTLSNF